MNQLINEPAQGSKNIWAIIAVAVITAVVVGGGIYLQQKSAIENEKNEIAETVRGEFQQEIADLKIQLSQLKETQEVITVETPTNEEIKPSEPKEPVDPTVDWKTYRNGTYGYEVKHPKSWYFLEDACCPPPPYSVVLNNYSNKKSELSQHQFDEGIFSFSILHKEGKFEKLDEIGEVKLGLEEGKEHKYLTVNGADAIKFTENIYYIIENNSGCRITFSSKCTVCDQMLSTFKFTK